MTNNINAYIILYTYIREPLVVPGCNTMYMYYFPYSVLIQVFQIE